MLQVIVRVFGRGILRVVIVFKYPWACMKA